MTKARRRKPRFPRPAPRPTEDEPRYDEAADEPVFDEPVFEDDLDDPRFAASSTVSMTDKDSVDRFDEPVFEAVWEEETADADERPAKAIAVGSSSMPAAVSSPQKSPSVQSLQEAQDEYQWDSNTPDGSRGRRLGRTTPFWLMGGGLVLVLVVAFWLIFSLGNNGDDRQLTPAPGVADSAALSQGTIETEPVAEPTPEPEPTATPVPVFTPGQIVVVANTAGAGIRLRNEPGTGGTTLAIYEDGDRFTILNPDGEYSSYPIEADGYRWYRIQITGNPEENLSGWAAGDFLTPSE